MNNNFNPMNAWTGMRLSYWAYEYDDIKAAEKVCSYPEPWEYAQPGIHLPASFPTEQRDASGKITQEAWNTQHNAKGELENQIKVSINEKTHEIAFAFKGSDAWSNWTSDLGNAGASEFLKIQAQAQKAFDALKNDERFKDYRFSAVGHSLGGGMAQSFALRNQIDAHVYNSLPIARDTIQGDYFKGQGGYEAALKRYQDSGHQVHDVRTPNDIATHVYEGVMQNQYLSHHAGEGPTMLPGARIPDLLKTLMLASGSGTPVALAIMGKDHPLGSMVAAQQGLSLDAQGRYRIPEGQVDFAAVPAPIRQRFAELSASPVVSASQLEKGQLSPQRGSPLDRFEIRREDGSSQQISHNRLTGEIVLDHFDAQQRRTRHIELNERRQQPARLTEFDTQGRAIRHETLALHEPAQTQNRWAGIDALSTEQKTSFVKAYQHTGEGLHKAGYSTTEIGQICAAAVTHCSQHAGKGAPEQFYLSKDAQRLAVMHESRQLSEMPIASALLKSTEAHLLEAAQAREDSAAQRPQAPVQRRADAPEMQARA